MNIKKGDRVRALHHEFKGEEGTVYDIYEKTIIIVEFDKFPVKVATPISNLKLIEKASDRIQ